MLEIFAVTWLVTSNAKIALSYRQNPLKFGWITALLWFGSEFLGACIGALLSDSDMIIMYVFALVFAVIGGVISRVIVNNLEIGNYQTPDEKRMSKALESSHPLTESAEIEITNDKGKYCYFYLNGEPIKGTAVGESITVTVNQSINYASASFDRGGDTFGHFIAEVSDGETKQISFVNNKFTIR
jgi:hypothetical protein